VVHIALRLKLKVGICAESDLAFAENVSFGVGHGSILCPLQHKVGIEIKPPDEIEKAALRKVAGILQDRGCFLLALSYGYRPIYPHMARLAMIFSAVSRLKPRFLDSGSV
jgi:hypothetical protein